MSKAADRSNRGLAQEKKSCRSSRPAVDRCERLVLQFLHCGVRDRLTGIYQEDYFQPGM